MQLAVDVQIPEIFGGMDGETVYIGTCISQRGEGWRGGVVHISASCRLTLTLVSPYNVLYFSLGREGGGVEEPFHVLVAYPNSIT